MVKHPGLKRWERVAWTIVLLVGLIAITSKRTESQQFQSGGSGG
jgi:hypothetical protein